MREEPLLFVDLFDSSVAYQGRWQSTFLSLFSLALLTLAAKHADEGEDGDQKDSGANEYPDACRLEKPTGFLVFVASLNCMAA